MELMVGAKMFTTYLNVDAVAREFELRGWRVEKSYKELSHKDNLEAILNISKGNFHAGIPPSEFMRMQIETLRPQTLIRLFESAYKEGPAGTHGYLLSLFSGEGELWR